MSTSGKTRHVCILSVFVSFLAICFSVITILQFTWTYDLEERYEANLRKLSTLKAKCNGRGAEHRTPSSVEYQADVQQRDVSGSLHDLLVQMMAVQEKIILSHCMNNTNLCIQGPKGDVGPSPWGSAGYPGPEGPQGPPGPKGRNGSQGGKGTQGAQGVPGQKGEKGLSGSGVGVRGPLGSAGSPGLNGTDGVKGDPGPTGDPGLMGSNGYQGSTGSVGNTGFEGTKGEKGVDGKNGFKGSQGLRGKDGVQLDKDCLCLRKPVNVTAPTQIVATPNVPLQLLCDPNATNDKITWEVPNATTCSTIVPKGPFLSFSEFQTTQEGLYNCTFTNKYGSTKKIFDVQASGDPLNCTFDDNSLCFWRADINGMLTWAPHSGSTPTFNTGPEYDKTLGPHKSGYYAYMESSYGRRGNTTVMTSPELPGAPDTCFSFWYHMHGDDMGSLKVFVADLIQGIGTSSKCGEFYTLIGQMSGEQGTDWKLFSAQVSARTGPHRLIIEGVRGEGNFGDIAVDNVQSYPGPCTH